MRFFAAVPAAPVDCVVRRAPYGCLLARHKTQEGLVGTMEVLRQLLCCLLITSIPVWMILLSSRLGSLVWDCRFSRDGIDFVMLAGRLRVARYHREDIRDVEILDRWRSFGALQFSLALGNRFTRRVILVKLRSFPWRVALTPKDPEAAVRALGFRVT